MLGLDNPIHIAFVLVLLLLVFGAKRLPEMGKSMGAGLRGFKESISGEEPATHLTEAHTPGPAPVDALTAVPATTHEPAAETVDEHTPMAPAA
jgi:sec-independent protein translocase protein TatA